MCHLIISNLKKNDCYQNFTHAENFTEKVTLQKENVRFLFIYITSFCKSYMKSWAKEIQCSLYRSSIDTYNFHFNNMKWINMLNRENLTQAVSITARFLSKGNT